MAADFQQQVAAFAAAVAAGTRGVRANPEEQLKLPIMGLLRGAGEQVALEVDTVPEAQVEAVGRPDIAVKVGGLLVGYVELKRPGKGADAARLTGRDKEQWEKFQNLPNLLYSDGSEWALYRSGVRVGVRVRLPEDTPADGAAALFTLLRDFLYWEPTIPATPRALAEVLAPLARLLRDEVRTTLADPASDLSLLAEDWRRYLFPDADDAQFADAYAQTLTYALLLARLTGAEELTVAQAVRTLRRGHHLLADTLKILGDEQARASIAVPLDLLERVIAAVDVETLTEQREQDLWLYFYEEFLAAYDPKMRRDRGVYYTPIPVVHCQVRLVSQLLAERFGAAQGFVDETVQTLDPATGTGTYLLAAIQHGLEQAARRGPGARASAATIAARNSHAFELLVGPYAVAHLRLTQLIRAEGGELPADGPHIYLTDTLDAPHGLPPQPPLLYRQLTDEYKRAQRIKSAQTPILVCIGNPPYDRQQLDAEEEAAGNKRKGGWVRFGDAEKKEKTEGILKDFIEPLGAAGLGGHAKNLYNDYVYFWRWALWKLFESAPDRGGIVSFITAASYLRGPGFAGMRERMRRTFDELWIIDLEGDSLGARTSENVFAIRSPVAIATGVRYGPPRPDTPAIVRYCRLTGSREEKLEALERVHRFDDLPWRECLSGWGDPFLPTSAHNPYWAWPLLTDLFPWQQNGVQFKRTWPIAETREALAERWAALLATPPAKRAALLHSTPARTMQRPGKRYDGDHTPLPPLASLPADAPSLPPSRYAFRSFDRRWALLDDRLADRPRPDLLLAHGPQQLYLTSLLTAELGEGPSAVVANHIPDLHHFSGRGGRDVIPLWRDRAGREANVTGGLLARLGECYGQPVTPEQLFAYAYALLATPDYVTYFWDELTLPGPRLPLTQEAAHFVAGVALGERLIWLHTFGERCVPPGQRAGELPPGQARILVATPQSEEAYPNSFSYDAASQTLHISSGQFAPVPPAVWAFSVSGLRVVESWLAYRMRERKGKSSSPLDAIRPRRWSFDNDLLDLLWLLEGTLALFPQAAALLDAILAGPLFTAADLPTPAPWERHVGGALPLFDE